MGLLFVIILLDLMGIGIFNPIFPFFATKLGASPEVLTLIIALYPIGSFIASPLWGRLSDKWGRRPILMISQAGAVVAYITLGFADNLWLVILSRLVGGFAAGNIGAAFAYITDITTPQNRTKGMGMVGGALSLSFIIGPMVGALLAGTDKSAANFGLIAFFCAGMNFLALMGTVFFLPESLTDEMREKLKSRPHQTRLQQFSAVRARRGLLLLFLATLVFGTGGSMFESTFALWGMSALDFGPRQVGLMLSLAAVIMVIMQIFVVGRLAKRFGELKLTIFGCISYAIGLALIVTSVSTPLVDVFGFITVPIGLIIGQIFLPIGLSTFNPSVSSLVSKEAQPTERGMVLGLYTSVGSLGRAVGPLFSGALFGMVAITAPFMYGIAAMAVTILLILTVTGKTAPPQATPAA